MGYAIGDVGSSAVKQGIMDTQYLICNGMLIKPSQGTTEETMYKKTIDFTNIDYLDFIVNVGATGATVGTVKLKIDGVTKADVDDQEGGDTADCVLTQIDCTSITGDNTILITGDNDNAGGYTWAKEIFLYTRES